jgi:uncharacterized protein YjiS (DUF1127 family)
MRPRIDTDQWARHAGASNGFGDPGLYSVSAAREVADAGRDAVGTLGDGLAAAGRAALAWLRAANARRRQRREARDVYEALRHLDDRTLHDLGFSRSELTSVAAEASGQAIRTRAHTLQATYGLPG